MTCCDHGYGRPSWRPRVSAPATYRLGTPRTQHPVVARWHTHLRALAKAIHDISGLDAALLFLSRMPAGHVIGMGVKISSGLVERIVEIQVNMMRLQVHD